MSSSRCPISPNHARNGKVVINIIRVTGTNRERRAGLFRIASLAVLLVCSTPLFAREQSVSESTFSGKWPFVTTEGTVKCTKLHGRAVVTFVTTAGEFAVNGIARSRGFMDVDPIWLDSEDIPGAKISMRDMLNYGLTLCN